MEKHGRDDHVDQLALEFTGLGVALSCLTPVQKRVLEKSLASPPPRPRLVVTRNATFRGTSLNKSQREPHSGTAAPERVQPAAPPLARYEIADRLQKAAVDGMLEWDLVGRFATQPQAALAQVPYDVRVQYGIPRALDSDLQKAAPAEEEYLSKGDIRWRLERAVRQGAIDPRTLGLFASNPARALQYIPEEIRKSYGIPRALPDPLQKSQTARADMSTPGVYARLMEAVDHKAVHPFVKVQWMRWGRAVLAEIPEAIRKSYNLPSE
jgi:hypothetical protein